MGIEVRSDFEVVNAPRNEAERMRAARIIQANPEAFSGNALADKASQAKEAEAKKQEKLLVQAFHLEKIHQADRLYELGGYKASGTAWAYAYDDALADYDSFAKRHHLEGERKQHIRDNLEELQEIAHRKKENQASEADFKRERELIDDTLDQAPSVIREIGQNAQSKDAEMENTFTEYTQKEDVAVNQSDYFSDPPVVVATTDTGLNF